MNKLITTIKDRIKEIIDKRGISIYELANQADVSEACIRNWYSKRDYTPSLSSLINIYSVLGISLSQLTLTEDEKMYPINNETKLFLDAWFALDINVRRSFEGLVMAFNKDKPNDNIPNAG